MSIERDKGGHPRRAPIDDVLDRIRGDLARNGRENAASYNPTPAAHTIGVDASRHCDDKDARKRLQSDELFPNPPHGIVFNGRNLERMAHLMFPHSRAQGVKDDVREIQVGDGFIRIKAIPSTGHYTHKVQETLLACLKHWQNNANRSGEVWVTMSDLCRLKGVKPSGSHIVTVKRHLHILYDTVQDWVRAYDVDGQPTDMMKFRFFSEFTYTDGTRRGDVSNFNKRVYLRFHPLLTADMIAGNINPVAMATLLSIKNELAASWFKYTDTRITQNRVGRITGRAMVDKLMLSPNRYRKPSKRRLLLETLLAHCDGRVLSNGRVYECFIEKTSDGKDFMLIERAGKKAVEYAPLARAPVVNSNEDQIQQLAQDIFEVVGGQQNMQWYRYIGRHCSDVAIHRALSEYRQAVRVTTPRSQGAYFTKILRSTLESMGSAWIARDEPARDNADQDAIKH